MGGTFNGGVADYRRRQPTAQEAAGDLGKAESQLWGT
jgi:hypothetical protein